MKYYIEITLINNKDFSPYQIWTQLYAQLHLAFVKQKDHNDKIGYGVSFPQYRVIDDKNLAFLGFKLRVFANTADELQALNLSKHLARLIDYVHITSIKSVPDSVKGHACYHRVIPRMSMDERIKHQAKRHQVSLPDARTHLQNYQPKDIATPFIQLKSLSNHNDFALHIGKKPTDKPVVGQFGTYGLSRTTTVPEF